MIEEDLGSNGDAFTEYLIGNEIMSPLEEGFVEL
jgi:hypothetical protein